MVPLQVPGGPELLIIILIYGIFALLPVIAALVALYLLYKIRGDVKRIMVSDVAFDALNGGASHVVRELVERNPKFEGSAGLTAHRFVEREVRVSARGAP